MRVEHRGAGVRMLGKAIGHFLAKVIDVGGLGVNVETVGIAIWPQVIDSPSEVEVRMASLL